MFFPNLKYFFLRDVRCDSEFYIIITTLSLFIFAIGSIISVVTLSLSKLIALGFFLVTVGLVGITLLSGLFAICYKLTAAFVRATTVQLLEHLAIKSLKDGFYRPTIWYDPFYDTIPTNTNHLPLNQTIYTVVDKNNKTWYLSTFARDKLLDNYGHNCYD